MEARMLTLKKVKADDADYHATSDTKCWQRYAKDDK